MTKEISEQVCSLLAQVAPDVKVEKAEISANNRFDIMFKERSFVSSRDFEQVTSLLAAFNLHYWIEASISKGVFISVM